MLSGTFIHRHRIPLPSAWQQQHANATNINSAAAHASGYYSIAHLNVGKTVQLYGRHFTLLSCDRFTRLLLQKLGAFVPENHESFVEEAKVEVVDKHVKVKTEKNLFFNVSRCITLILRRLQKSRYIEIPTYECSLILCNIETIVVSIFLLSQFLIIKVPTDRTCMSW